ncbi:MAG: hypothetical protein R2752_05575 [Vicinamibacterales bacterium]
MSSTEIGLRIIAGLQIVVGLASIVFGIRDRSNGGDRLAPLGTVMVVAGAFPFLAGIMPDSVLFPLAGLAMVAALTWFVSRDRQARARMRDRQSPTP